MRLKLPSALLVLALGACACLVPFAQAAASEKAHACCPAPDSGAGEPDCCMRAVLPSVPSPAAPRAEAAAAVHAAPVPVIALVVSAPAAAAAQPPPGRAAPRALSARAPPASRA